MRIIVTKTDASKSEEEPSTTNIRPSSSSSYYHSTASWPPVHSVPNPDQEEEEFEEKRPTTTSTQPATSQYRGSTSMTSSTFVSPLKAEEDEQDFPPSKKKKKKRSNASSADEGYNSSEEQPSLPPPSSMTKEQFLAQLRLRAEDFQKFQEELRRKYGFVIKRMAEDGNCLFRSIADQVFGDAEMHDQVRERCMNYMSSERDHFSQYVTEDFNDYIKRKRRNAVYGNNLEIQALGELFNRPIEIFRIQNGTVIKQNLFHDQYQTDYAPIRLSYHNGNHYNSVVDPNSPSVGVGLGLPNFEPGLADKLQMRNAIMQSENLELERALLDETRRESELEEAQLEIEQAIIEQSQRELEEAVLAASRKEYLDNLAKNAKKT